MGEVKNNMQTTTKDNSGKSSPLGFLKRKDAKEVSSKDKANSFADMITQADETLSKLILVKEAELISEKGQEESNRRKLATLKTMRFHLDETINQAADYADIK